MLDFIKECNKPGWRLNRKKFWLYPLWLGLSIMVIVWLLWFVLWMILWEIGWQIAFWIWAIAYLYLIYVSIASYIKRLHDLDKTGWMSLLAFVPFANIYLFIICGFFVWTTWKNQYWEDPLGWTTPVVAEANSTPSEL